jgi:hypothetical protein
VNHITTKKINYRLWQSGEFGNKLRAWPSIESWRASGFNGNVVLRTMMAAAGGPCRYDLSPGLVGQVVSEWTQSGVPLSAIMVNEAAPDECSILQGEFWNGVLGWCWSYLHYSFTAKHMRESLKEGAKDIDGLKARLLLKGLMTPASYEDWCEVLERWPDHAIEVSIYDRCVGDRPHRNSLIWEVRQY